MTGLIHTAEISWKCEGNFAENQFSRGHVWRFDGGTEVPASASPTVVTVPGVTVAEAVDPEEAFVAAISSCHMLWFLDFARRGGFDIAAYEDKAEGSMTRIAPGRMAISKVALRPLVTVRATNLPDPSWFKDFHKKAHEVCFIANSVNSEIIVTPEPVRLVAP